MDGIYSSMVCIFQQALNIDQCLVYFQEIVQVLLLLYLIKDSLYCAIWHLELTPKVAAHPIFLEITEILKLDSTKMSQWVDVPLAVFPLPRVAHTCQSLKMLSCT